MWFVKSNITFWKYKVVLEAVTFSSSPMKASDRVSVAGSATETVLPTWVKVVPLVLKIISPAQGAPVAPQVPLLDQFAINEKK